MVLSIAEEKKLTPQAKYDKANTKKIVLKLNIHKDNDIFTRLDEVPSKQGYIKTLIRKDISETKKTE